MTITSYSNTDYRSVVDYERYDILQDFSDNDNVIEYYIQGVTDNYYPYYVNNVLDFSLEEKKYIRFAMAEFSRLTGANFVETADFESGVINLIKIDSYNDGDYVGLNSVEDGWIDASWVNYGGDKMTDYEKWLVWHEVGHSTGLLHPNNDDSHSDQAFTSDISVMSDNEANSYPTHLRDLDIQAIRHVWGQTSSPAFIRGEDPTLPTISVGTPPPPPTPTPDPTPTPTPEEPQIEDEIITFNEIKGSSKKDRLKGTSGADHISGLGGDDKINGKDGDDLIDPGKWTTGKFDKIKGGNGSDTFVIKDGYWAFIKDFEIVEDKLDISGISQGLDWEIIGKKTYIFDDEYEVARLKGKIDLSDANFI